jgi:hypothetical protein
MVKTRNWIEKSSFSNKAVEIQNLAVELLGAAGLSQFLPTFEKRFNIKLTPAAVLMLMLPLVDAETREGVLGKGFFDVSDNELRLSLKQMLKSMADDPARADALFSIEPSTVPEERSALSVVKAFWKTFCNIPPFCWEK